MWMQGKVNVLHYQTGAAGVGERHVAKLKAPAEGAGRREGIRRSSDRRLHREEIKQVFEEDSLLRNVVEPGENLLDIRPRAVEGAGQKREAAKGHSAGQSPREDYRICPVVAPGRNHVEGRTEECAPHR